MQKGIRFVFAICLFVTLGIVCLQAFWLNNFYVLTKDRLEKEVNLAFEDAIKKEFTKRNDSIERLLFRFMMDTSKIRLTSRRNSKDGRQMYQVINAQYPKDSFSFSRKEMDFPLLSGQDSNRSKVASAAARLDREQDLDHHIIFYRTQNIGRYLTGKAGELAFDTARLRPFLKEALQQRDITEAFVFTVKDEDNTLNRNTFSDSLTSHYPVITKAFPTFKNKMGENYVRACFPSPSGYVFSKSIGLLAGSALLLIIVSIAFAYLIRIIRKEKKLSAIKNDFVNHITHEFKTPIATVYSAVQALDTFNMGSDPVKAKRYLTISKTELERLSDLVTKVLHISLYERPDFEMKKEVVDIDQIIGELLPVYQEAGGIAVAVTYIKDSGSVQVRGDKTHLYNAINNLIDNAIKYAGANPHIQIRLFQEQRYLVVSVKDNGPGILQEHQQFIFDKFYRIPQQNAAIKGFGLGLSYLKDVLEKHKGWHRVESKIGQGSTFFIGLPLMYEA